MTSDEAISIMNVIVHMLEPQYDTDRVEEAVEMAIEALKQQPTDAVDRVTIKEYLDSFGRYTNATLQTCEDVVSRQAVLDGIASIAKIKVKSDAQKSLIGRIMFFVEKLPSVTPQQKMGQWEWNQYDSNPNIGNWHCSECRTIIPHMPEETDNTPIYKWCPMCGCKMREVEG